MSTETQQTTEPKKSLNDQMLSAIDKKNWSLVANLAVKRSTAEGKSKEAIKLNPTINSAVKMYQDKKTTDLSTLKKNAVRFGTTDDGKIDASTCKTLAKKLMGYALKLELGYSTGN